MALYTALPTGGVRLNAAPPVFIPADPANGQWAAYVKWAEEGGVAGSLDDDLTSAQLGDRLKAEVADKRWRIETGGLTVGGMPVDTSDRTKLLVTGARIRADAEPEAEFRWKAASGVFVTLTSEQIIAIADALAAFVQALFDAESDHVDAIDALVVEDNWDALRLYDIDAGWPT